LPEVRPLASVGQHAGAAQMLELKAGDIAAAYRGLSIAAGERESAGPVGSDLIVRRGFLDTMRWSLRQVQADSRSPAAIDKPRYCRYVARFSSIICAAPAC